MYIPTGKSNLASNQPPLRSSLRKSTLKTTHISYLALSSHPARTHPSLSPGFGFSNAPQQLSLYVNTRLAATTDRAEVLMTSSNGNAFVYGTLIAPEVLKLVIGRVPEMHDAVLSGFRRYKLRNRAYPGILPDASSSVRGKILHGITQVELDLLDEYEGGDYVRQAVDVESRGATYEAGVYVWKLPTEALANEPEWSYEAFRSNDAIFKQYLQQISHWKDGEMSIDEYLSKRVI